MQMTQALKEKWGWNFVKKQFLSIRECFIDSEFCWEQDKMQFTQEKLRLSKASYNIQGGQNKSIRCSRMPCISLWYRFE